MSKKILIVEDEEDIIRILGLRVEMYGYDAVFACNGEVALIKTREEKPDLILLDIRMPDLNGLEFMNRLFTDEEICHIPVIMVTAYAEPEIEARCLEMGARFYVTKPFDLEYLKSCIEKCIGTSE
jgi:CheY-like chemotaxis protein